MCADCPQMYDEVSGPGSRFKEKHSLDSDEEDEGEDGERNSKYNILASDDIEGVLLRVCYQSVLSRKKSFVNHPVAGGHGLFK